MAQRLHSLADEVIANALNHTSAARATEYELMSVADLAAMPHRLRGPEWIAHNIAAAPAYRLEPDFARQVWADVEGRADDPLLGKRFADSLDQSPALYRPADPVIWLEWEGTDGRRDGLRNGILIEDLFQQGGHDGTLGREGLKVTLFASSPAGEMFPAQGQPVMFGYGTMGHVRIGQLFANGPAVVKNGVFGADYDKQNDALRRAFHFAVTALAKLKARNNIAIVPAADGAISRTDPVHHVLKTLGSIDIDQGLFPLSEASRAPKEVSFARFTGLHQDKLSQPSEPTKVFSFLSATGKRDATFAPLTLSKLASENTAANSSDAGSLPAVDFTHHIHGSDEWYIDGKGRLKPLLELLGLKTVDPYELHAFTPVLKPRELSDAASLSNALVEWRDRMRRHISEGYSASKMFGEASRWIEEDFPKYQSRIPEYLRVFLEKAPSQLGKAKPLDEGARDIIVRAFKDDSFMPLPFATLLAHFGTRFIMDNGATRFAHQGFAVLGPSITEAIKTDDRGAQFDVLSHVLISAVGNEAAKMPAIGKTVRSLLTSTVPQEELPFMRAAYRDAELMAEAISILHARHPLGDYSAVHAKALMPRSASAYKAFLGLASYAAINSRPDLNNALEGSRAAFVHAEPVPEASDATSYFTDLLRRPIIDLAPATRGTPDDAVLTALQYAFSQMLPSEQAFYNARPVTFFLAGPDKPHFARQLSFASSSTALIVGSDYLDPVQIRKWFTGIPIKDGQPLTLGVLDADGVRVAASRGLIKGALHATFRGDATEAKVVHSFEKELKSRLPSSHVDGTVKRIIVAAILGEVALASRDDRFQKKFPMSIDATEKLTKFFPRWVRDITSGQEPILPASGMTFTVNQEPGVHTAPQRALFETLNGLLVDLKITPEDLDDGFRFEVMKLKNWLQFEELDWINGNKPKDRLPPYRKDLAEIDDLKRQLVTPIPSYDVRKQDPAHLAGMSGIAFDYNLYMRFYPTNIVAPSYATQQEKDAYQQLLEKDPLEKNQASYDPYEGILQTYAFGSKALDVIHEAISGSQLKASTEAARESRIATSFFGNAVREVTGAKASGSARLVRSKIDQMAQALSGIQKDIADELRPSFDKFFELALLGAVDGFIRHTFAGAAVPLSIEQKRAKLETLFVPVESSERARGLVFQSHDALFLDEQKRLHPAEARPNIGKASATDRNSGEDYERQRLSPFLSQTDEERAARLEEKRIREENTAAPIPMLGVTLQRILREATKTHPNNTPERNDNIRRMDGLSRHLRSLGSTEVMNAKFAPHSRLAEVLFGDEVMRVLEATNLLQDSLKVKLPVVSEATRARAAEALRHVFDVGADNEAVRLSDLMRNERLKTELVDFPQLLIAALATNGALKELRDKFTMPLDSDLPAFRESDVAKRSALVAARDEKARTLMAAIGIDLPRRESPEPVPPPTLALTLAASSDTTVLQGVPLESAFTDLRSDERIVPKVPFPAPVETAQTEDGVLAPAVFKSIIADEQGDIPVQQNLPSSPAAILNQLSDDQLLDRMIKRDEAMKETGDYLLAEAGMYLAQAQNGGFNQFDARIDLKRPGFPINLSFWKEIEFDGEKRSKRMNVTLDKYASAYAERGIPLTMIDAVDLKIAVQSLILNTEGMSSPEASYGSGSASVGLDTPMPLPIRDFKITQSSAGMYGMKFEARDPYNGLMIYPSIPLGVAARHLDEAVEQQDLDERARYVLDFLHEIQEKRTPEGYGIRISKRDVMDRLEAWLSDQNKEWVTAEREKVPGFEKATLVHVSAGSNQKIMLAPLSLRMDMGGDNPSWHCSLPFYIGDKTKRPMGELVHTRSLNLHTRNKDLAVARTLETLLGVTNKSGVKWVEGFLPDLQRHMQATNDEWRVENKGEKTEQVYIGNKPFRHFLDDMMRYERDIGIKLESSATEPNGDIRITLQALRGLIGAFGRKIIYTPEYVHESENDARKPVTFSLTVPADHTHRVNAFIEAVHQEIGWHAEESYSSRALGTNGQADMRKEVLEYRTSQIRRASIRAIEERYEDMSQKRLPKNWHRPETASAATVAADYVNSAKAYRKRSGQSGSLDSEDPSTRHRRKPSEAARHALG